MSREEAAQICARFVECLADLIVIGGQAVAAWAEHYQVANGPTSSKDLDFASRHRRVPERVGQLLEGETYTTDPLAGLCVGTQVAKVAFSHGDKRHIIDFLGAVVGVSNTERMWSRAIAYTPPGTEYVLHILHPLDCLYSRVGNICTYPQKYDTEMGRAQLAASCAVFKQFVHALVASGESHRIQAAATLTRELMGYLQNEQRVREVGGQDLHACLEWYPEFEPHLSRKKFDRKYRRKLSRL